MSKQNNSETKRFEYDVIEIIEGLKAMDYTNPMFGMQVANAISTNESALDAFPRAFKGFRKIWKGKKPLEIEKDIRKATAEAKNLTKRKEIKAILCPALKSVGTDAIEIAKVTIPLLVGASISGTIVFNLDPLLYAVLVLVIARTGIASICTEYDKNEKNKF